MAKRIKIGLLFSYNENWIGGAYYILNLIYALKTLPEEHKPDIYLITFKQEDYLRVSETGYPYLNLFLINERDYNIKYYWHERILNFIWRKLTKKKFIDKSISAKKIPPVDLLFPATSNNPIFSSAKNRLRWIPDFQHAYLPLFFSQEEIQKRNETFNDWATKPDPILFSSNDALNHFKLLYPKSSTPLFVANFAVTLPVFTQLDLKAIKEKHNLPDKYYMAPNQFWAHKNHKVIIEAVKSLRDSGLSLTVAFTGKEDDYRNPAYAKELKKLVTEYHLDKEILFLGFIDRAEQLLLMQHAIAIIQPSLFEGWSTVVEDAKAINQFIIASDIPVHQEQNNGNIEFFEPNNSEQLGRIIKKYYEKQPVVQLKDYKAQITKFGVDLFAICKEIVYKE